MQNDPMTVRGFSPQDTGRMNTLPYQPPQLSEKPESIWKQLDPAALMLIAAAVLGLAYGLFATISYWWAPRLTIHLVLVWVTVGFTLLALFTGNRTLKLIAAIGYLVSLLLFLNYFYFLLPQIILCVVAWIKSA